MVSGWPGPLDTIGVAVVEAGGTALDWQDNTLTPATTSNDRKMAGFRVMITVGII